MEIQSANRQHPVPQNVMEVEFKLIGDLTIRQFTYLLIFGILSFLVGYSALPGIFKWPLLLILILMGLGFAFFPLNDIPLDKWFVNYVKAITKPRFRVWKHVKNTPYYFTYVPQVQGDSTKYYDTKTTVKQKKSLDDLLNVNKPKSIDFANEEDIKVKENDFFKKIGLSNQTIVHETKTIPQNQPTTPLPITQPNSGSLADIVIPAYKPEEEHELKNNYSSIANLKENKKTIPIQTKKIEEIILNKEEPQKDRSITEKTNTQNLPITPDLPNLSTKSTDNSTSNSALNSEASKVLEESKKLNKELAKESLDYQKHLKELNLLKQKLLKEIETNKYKFLDGKEEEIITYKEEKEKEVLEDENKKLKDKLKKYTAQRIINSDKANMDKSPLFASFLLKLKGDNQEGDISQQQTQKTQDQKEQKQSDDLVGDLTSPSDAQTIRSKIKKADKSNTFKLKGNTIDEQGNLIGQVVVIVKNSANEAVRALKSNSLGEFESSTELENGKYYIEATKEGYSFDKLNINTSENQVGLVKLVGKKL